MTLSERLRALAREQKLIAIEQLLYDSARELDRLERELAEAKARGAYSRDTLIGIKECGNMQCVHCQKLIQFAILKASKESTQL